MTVMKTEDYQVDLEYNAFFFILHLPIVQKFTRDMYLELVVRLDELKDFAKTIGYAQVFAVVSPEHKSTEKLVKKFGFSLRGEANNMLVYEMELGED